MEEEKSALLKESEDKPQLSKTKQNCMLFTVLSLQFCSICADTLIFPFFPKIAADRGWGNFHTGIVFASFDMARFVTSPIAGSLLLKWHPKSMCAFGNLLTALSCVGFGSVELIKSNEWFLGLCVVIRLCAGIGSAMLTVAATSLLMKATSYKASTIVTLIEIMQGTGYTVGPMYGAFLFTMTGYSPMFWILGALMLLFLPAFIVVVPKVEERAKSSSKKFFDLLRIPGCLLMFLHCFMMKFCARSPGLGNWITEGLHAKASTAAVVMALFSTIYALLSCPIFSRVVNRGYIYETMIASWFTTGIISLFVGPTPLFDFIFHGHRHLWLTTLAASGIYLLAAGIFLPTFQAALNLAKVSGHQADSLHTYGMVSGLVNCGLSLGSTVGPVASGLITDYTNYAWTNTVFTGLSWIMSSLIFIYYLHMSLTSQPLDPEECPGTADEGIKISSEKIAEACEEKFSKMLRDSNTPTKLSQVQPE